MFGMSSATTAIGKSQRGPNVNSSGSAAYSPPAARIAMIAGQRGSGSSASAFTSARIRVLSVGQHMDESCKDLHQHNVMPTQLSKFQKSALAAEPYGAST